MDERIPCPKCSVGGMMLACDPQTEELFFECDTCTFARGPEMPASGRRKPTRDDQLNLALVASIEAKETPRLRPGDKVTLIDVPGTLPEGYRYEIGILDRYSVHGAWWWVRFKGEKRPWPVDPSYLLKYEEVASASY